MLDPSVIFADEGLEWIADPDLRPFLVLSRAFYALLEDRDAQALLAPFGEPAAPRIEQAADAIRRGELRLYSYEQSLGRTDLPAANRNTLEALLTNEQEPLASVFADEWAFLTTESIISLKDLKQTVQAWARAGADWYGATRAEMEKAFDAAREKIPEPVRNKMKRIEEVAGSAPVRFFAFGGGIAGMIVPVIGIPAGTALAVIELNGFIAGDP